MSERWMNKLREMVGKVKEVANQSDGWLRRETGG
jgi:hypothetical protein